MFRNKTRGLGVTLSIALILALILAFIGWRAVRSVLGPTYQPLDDNDLRPPGSWQRVPFDRIVDDRRSDERARLLSLPYVAGRSAANESSGVVFQDLDRIAGGVNVYVSGHGPEAYLIDRDGHRLHSWKLPFEQVFPTRVQSRSLHDWRRVAWCGDGSLIVLVQAGGLFEIDAQSRLRWALDRGVYNDLQLLDSGEILVVTKRSRSIEGFAGGREILEDWVELVDRQGRVQTGISLLDALRNSEFAFVLDPLPAGSDILHTNTLEMIAAEETSIFSAGQLLVSFREIDTIAVVDLEASEVVWAQRGPWARQHQPSLVEGGNILLFDNRGASEDALGVRSRILEFDPASGDIVWSFERDGFYSREGGSVQRLANGNTLITSSEQGTAFEIEPSGEVVWEFISPHRAGTERELIANLWELIRIEQFDLEFAEQRGADRDTEDPSF